MVLVVAVRMCHIWTTFTAEWEEVKLNSVTWNWGNANYNFVHLINGVHYSLVPHYEFEIIICEYGMYMNIYTWFNVITCNISNISYMNETQRVGVAKVNPTWQFFSIFRYEE